MNEEEIIRIIEKHNLDMFFILFNEPQKEIKNSLQ